MVHRARGSRGAPNRETERATDQTDPGSAPMPVIPNRSERDEILPFNLVIGIDEGIGYAQYANGLARNVGLPQ